MRRAALAAVAAVLSATTALGQGTTTEARIGAWEVMSYRNDAGEFRHCSTLANYRSGISFMVFLDKSFGWQMGFANTAWALQPGAQYPITYWIDNGVRIPAVAEVALPTFVAVKLIDNAALFDAFRRGRTLSVLAAGERFQFDLTNSSRALTAVAECTARYTAAASQNPFASETPSQGKGTASANVALKVEAATFTANLLSAAGIPDFSMLEEVPDVYQDYHSVFVAPGIVGGMKIMPEETESSLSTTIIAYVSDRCAGKAATARLPMSNSGVHIQAICEENGKKHESSYFILRRKRGGVYGVELTGVEIPPAATNTLPAPAQERPERSLTDLSGRLVEAGLNLTK